MKENKREAVLSIITLFLLLFDVSRASKEMDFNYDFQVFTNPVIVYQRSRDHVIYWPTRKRKSRSYPLILFADAGYGSRVLIASRIMRAILAYHYVYGPVGPG